MTNFRWGENMCFPFLFNLAMFNMLPRLWEIGRNNVNGLEETPFDVFRTDWQFTGESKSSISITDLDTKGFRCS